MNTEKILVNETSCNIHEHKHHHPQICWSVIFVGAFVGIGLAFLLHLFAVAIGLSAYRSSVVSLPEMAIGGILGILISVIVAMGVAGFTAGYLGRCHTSPCNHGVVYGFLTWTMMLILSAIFTMPVTHYVSAYTKQLVPTTVVVVKDTNMTENQDVSTPAKNEHSLADKPDDTMKTAAKELVGISWLIFILFFVGALSSCIGACYGLRCCSKEEHHH